MENDAEELLENAPWAKITERLTEYAYCKLGFKDLAEAENIACEAIAKLLEKGPKAGVPLPVQLGSIVNGIVSNRWRTKSVTQVKPRDFSSPRVAGSIASPTPSQEERLLLKDEARRALKLLDEEIRGDEQAESVLLLEYEGFERPDEQAAQLDLPKATIYKARFRLGQARQRVRSRMQGEG